MKKYTLNLICRDFMHTQITKIAILKSLRLGKRSPLITPTCLKRDQIKKKCTPLPVTAKLSAFLQRGRGGTRFRGRWKRGALFFDLISFEARRSDEGRPFSKPKAF